MPMVVSDFVWRRWKRLSDLNDRGKQIFPRDIKTIAGSGLSIKLLSASTAFCDKTGFCINWRFLSVGTPA